jgi:hypothetical protein
LMRRASHTFNKGSALDQIDQIETQLQLIEDRLTTKEEINWFAEKPASAMAPDNYRSARAFAVKPLRQKAQPCGRWGLTAKARPSKGTAVP